MRVSCIIPTFLRLDLVTRCLHSVIAQRGVSLEIIITDDSPGPAIREAALGWACDDLRYVEGPRTGNPVDNWNHGLAQATGEACVVIHQDEWFTDQDFLQRGVALLQKTGAAAVLGGVKVEGATRRSNFAVARRAATILGHPLWLLPLANWMGPTAAFIFRGVRHRFDPDLVQLVDIDFYRRVARDGPIAVLPGPAVGSLGHHDDQITARIDPLSAARKDLITLRDRVPPGISRMAFHGFDACFQVASWRR